jgi:hypothetical protein
MIQVDNDEPKMQVFVPAYLPLQNQVCDKCKTVMVEPKELIRITKDSMKSKRLRRASMKTISQFARQITIGKLL